MDLEEAIRSIPEKKLKLQNALNALNSIATATPFFTPNTLQWKDLEAHFSAIEASIHDHLHRSKTLTLTPAPPKSLCSQMDSSVLASLLASDPHGGLAEIYSHLALSPDPAHLVLDLMHRLIPSESDLRWIRNCFSILKELEEKKPSIEDSVRDWAKGLALKWKGGIVDSRPTDSRSSQVALVLLQLIATYGLVGELDIDGDVLPVLYVASEKKQAVYFVDRLGLREKLPNVIHKLSEDSHLLAIKFIYAFKLEDKFAVVPLLKGYINDVEKKAQEIREKGNYSVHSQTKATMKQLGSLRVVLKLVEEHKLETEYPREVLEKGMSQLVHQLEPALQAKQQEFGKKQIAAAAAAASRTNDQESGKKQSAAAAAAAAASASQTKDQESGKKQSAAAAAAAAAAATQTKDQDSGKKQSAAAAASQTKDQESGKKRSATAASQTNNHQRDGKKQHATTASQSKISQLQNKHDNRSQPLAAATSRPLFPAYGYLSSGPSHVPYIGVVHPFGAAVPGTFTNHGGLNPSATTMGHRGPSLHSAGPYAGPTGQYYPVAYGGHAASGLPPHDGPLHHPYP